jgi:type I restriction enzyme, S subunit
VNLLKRRFANRNLKSIGKDWLIKPLPKAVFFQEGPGLRNWQWTMQGMKVINVTNLEDGFLNLEKTDRHISLDEFNEKYRHFEIQESDIVMASSGATYCKTAIVRPKDLPLMMNTSVIRFKPLNDVNHSYLKFFLSSFLFKDQIDFLITGGAQPNFGPAHIKQSFIALPPLIEQQKIAKILNTWDKAIQAQNLLINESLRRKKGLEQQLLSGKIRFPEFIKSSSSIKTPVGELSEDWELRHISDIVQRIKKAFTPEPEKMYREIGIRSHCKGIFHKEEVTGASVGSKSVFWIQTDCFVVNIVFAWEHAIAKTTEAEIGMIASHRFPMYKPTKGILDLDYLLYYFKTARGKHLLGLASPGGAGRNKTLGQGEFAKLKIPVPSLAEQKRIVAVLSEADREIELLKQQIATLKEQKKGLMQKLLTGEIRTI